MDPLLNLPIEICEIIFDNLTTQELLTSSIVSQMWYTFIASPYFVRKKIMIKVGKSVNVNIVKESARKYDTISINGFDLEKEIILLTTIQWKTVYLNSSTFLHLSDLFSYMSFFAQSVQKLLICKVKITNYDEKKKLKIPQFPNLKTLILQDVPSTKLLVSYFKI